MDQGHFPRLAFALFALCFWGNALELAQSQESPDRLPRAGISEADSSRAGSASIPKRTWHDKTGKFSVEAKLLDVSEGKVRLLRSVDRTVIEMGLDSLSIEDKQYCLEVLADIERLDAPTTEAKALANDKPVESSDLRTIDQALHKYFSDLQAIDSRELTSIQRKLQEAEALKSATDAIAGKRIRLVFDVVDVKQVEEKILVAFGSPDVDIRITPKRLDLRGDPADAAKVKKGDFVRLDGRINERTRKAFMQFAIEFPLKDAPDLDDLDSLEALARRDRSEQKYFSAVLYVESVRKLTDEQAAHWKKSRSEP